MADYSSCPNCGRKAEGSFSSNHFPVYKCNSGIRSGPCPDPAAVDDILVFHHTDTLQFVLPAGITSDAYAMEPDGMVCRPLKGVVAVWRDEVRFQYSVPRLAIGRQTALDKNTGSVGRQSNSVHRRQSAALRPFATADQLAFI